MDYLFQILFFVGVYTVLAVSLDLLAGQTGLLSLAHAAFYSIGAYTSALLTIHLGIPFFIGILLGMVVAAAVSLFVSLPSLRLHEDYFVIATFGFQMVISTVLKNWVNVTGGQRGISGIPGPSLFGISFQSRAGFAAIALSLAALVYIAARQLSKSPYGRVLRAIREDEVFAESLGKNTLRFKVTIFSVTAAMAAAAGSLYAHYVTYIDPGSFTVLESILVISMVIIGGAGSLWGPPVGAAVLVILPEVLRFVGFNMPDQVEANVRQLLYGSLLVLIMLVKPSGIAGRYDFGR